MIERPERDEPLGEAGEHEQLDLWLDFHRLTLLDKCSGLTFEQLKTASVPPSTLTLLGLLRHMTQVEMHWFEYCFEGVETQPPYSREDDPDADFNDLDSAALDDVHEAFLTACDVSRSISVPADLDTLAAQVNRHTPRNLRWIYLHMIEEYARHNGHADLLRQCIDGSVGD
jgi:uncharacterized damage-inducible protein DinB